MTSERKKAAEAWEDSISVATRAWSNVIKAEGRLLAIPKGKKHGDARTVAANLLDKLTRIAQDADRAQEKAYSTMTMADEDLAGRLKNAEARVAELELGHERWVKDFRKVSTMLSRAETKRAALRQALNEIVKHGVDGFPIQTASDAIEEDDVDSRTKEDAAEPNRRT